MSALGEVQQQQHYELTPKWVVAQVMHVVDNIPSSDLLPIKLNISPACCCANARSFVHVLGSTDLDSSGTQGYPPSRPLSFISSRLGERSVTPFPYVRRQCM